MGEVLVELAEDEARRGGCCRRSRIDLGQSPRRRAAEALAARCASSSSGARRFGRHEAGLIALRQPDLRPRGPSTLPLAANASPAGCRPRDRVGSSRSDRRRRTARAQPRRHDFDRCRDRLAGPARWRVDLHGLQIGRLARDLPGMPARLLEEHVDRPPDGSPVEALPLRRRAAPAGARAAPPSPPPAPGRRISAAGVPGRGLYLKEKALAKPTSSDEPQRLLEIGIASRRESRR